MTTMPPEMSSAATATVVALPHSSGVQRDTHASLGHASSAAVRSRFMITDILAGSAAAAAAALHNGNGGGSPPPAATQHPQPLHPHHRLLVSQQQLPTQLSHHQQQQQQQHATLQHYLVQQQHLLQQHQQQHYHDSSPPHHPHHHGHLAQSSHPLAHLPPSALLGFPSGVAVGGAPNGLHAAAHYAALREREERAERLRDLGSPAGGGGAGPLDHDDRSRSPHLPGVGGATTISARDLSGSGTQGLNGGCGGGGGGGSSISGDQASTIDDSDSDSGAKDDDGNSIKSDNLMGGLSKKQRKARTAFTDHQLQTLEKSFERQKYLSVQDRMELANKLELSDCQVKTWYQNRRTKWKRQTAVGLELLAEAGNYAAFQRLYGGSPYLSAWPYAAQSPHGAPPSAIDLYYRQAAAAAALQKPLSYRMYHPSVPMGMPVPPHLSAANSLSSMSSYYQTTTTGGSGVGSAPVPPTHELSPVQSELSEKRRSSVELTRSPSPPLNPGSPPERADNASSCPAVSDAEDGSGGTGGATIERTIEEDDEEDAIEV